jgi:lipid II:glycine glycyltransferase (peptidoglycan interpeptide bridge formation enzyme)
MQWTKGTPSKEWDDALFAAGGHFLQSSHWAAFNEKLGRQVFYAYGPSWQCLAILEPARTGARLYCPYGPLAKNTKGLASALEALRQLAKKHKAAFARLEPIVPTNPAQLRELGLKPAIKDIQPRLTWVQNLRKSEDELLAGMTATNRNLYRNHQTKGLLLRASTDPKEMKIFIKMMAEVALRNRILQHPDKYYKMMAEVLLSRGAAKLYIAEHEGKPVASAFCFDSPTTRYYAHAAALFAARKLHPGTPLLVTMMLAAKAQEQKQFDFVGVAPADAPATHRWAGLTKFKQSFGGDYKAYAGTWELPVNNLRYAVYRSVYLAKTRLKRK